MIFLQKVSITTFLLSLNIATVNAFGFVPSLRVTSSIASPSMAKQQLLVTSNQRYVTSLYAEAGDNEASEGENKDAAAPKDGEKSQKKGSSVGDANDILNSPVFLKRKLEVLKSDVEKLNEKISAANKVYEDNKAEWGPQLDELKKEVS